MNSTNHYRRIPGKLRAFLLATCMVCLASACTTVGGPASSSITLSDEPLIGKFVWHDLITDDVEAAKKFYGTLFGWTFEKTTRPVNGGPYTLIRSGNTYVGGMVQLDDPGDGSDYSRWLGYVSVADVRVAARFTREAGGTVLVEPFAVPGVGHAAGIQDPQGAVVGLIRSKAGDPVDNENPVPGTIVWNELVADDDRAAAEFYSQLAGLETSVVDRRGGTYTFLKSGDLPRAGILQNPGRDEFPANWITHFSVVNPLATSIAAIEAGGKTLVEPAPDFREGSLALLADPTGAIFMVNQL